MYMGGCAQVGHGVCRSLYHSYHSLGSIHHAGSVKQLSKQNDFLVDVSQPVSGHPSAGTWVREQTSHSGRNTHCSWAPFTKAHLAAATASDMDQR